MLQISDFIILLTKEKNARVLNVNTCQSEMMVLRTKELSVIMLRLHILYRYWKRIYCFCVTRMPRER